MLQDVCSGPGSQQEASTIIRGIKFLTETTTNTVALKEMLTPAQHALAAGSPQLRAVGCDILSAWLKKQEPSADITQQVALLIHMLEVLFQAAPQPHESVQKILCITTCAPLSYPYMGLYDPRLQS